MMLFAQEPVRFERGFFDLETHSGFPFRWMAREARLAFAPRGSAGFVELSVRGHFAGLSQTLTVSAGDGARFEVGILRGWNRVSLVLPRGADGLLLETDRELPAVMRPGDDRALALQVGEVRLHEDAGRHAVIQGRHRQRLTSLKDLAGEAGGRPAELPDEVLCAEGCHVLEAGEDVAFRWIASRATLRFAPGAEQRYLELSLSSPFQDLSQRVTVTAGNQPQETQVLSHGRNLLSVAVPPGAERVVLEVNKSVPPETHPGDARELAAQLRMPLLHRDEYRHAQVQRQQANRVHNRRELLAGAVTLESTPPKLGVDLEGRCNIKPPCVYCEWDWNKGLEGDNAEVPFDLEQLRASGLFDNTAELVNCSIGEPFMIRGIDGILDTFGRSGKLLDVSTNGQILTAANIRRLLGRHVHLYVSLDAATAATYARLRNTRFESVIDNVQRLVDAKGGPGSLPLVFLVFMPMRANVHEVEAFVELAAELHVDRLTLRPLNPSEGTNLVWDRGGYHYDYQKELLPFEELVRISGRVEELCRAYGVQLSNQLSFGGELSAQFREAYERGRREAAADLAARAAAAIRAAGPGAAAPSVAPAVVPGPPAADEGARPAASAGQAASAEAPSAPPRAAAAADREGAEAAVHLPICTEPWTTLYVLRRGVLPCCYGGKPIAPMQEFAGAWNAPIVRDIRRALRAGRFHPYCFDSPACPIVRKAEERRGLSLPQRLTLAGQRTMLRVRRSGYGWPGRVYRGTKHVLIRGRAFGRRAVARLRGGAAKVPPGPRA